MAGARRPRATVGRHGRPPATIVCHFALAVGRLGIWIAFVASDVSALAWIAVGLILLVAGLGMAGLVAALPEAAAGGAGQPALARR